MNEKFLKRIEEDQEREMRQLEEKTRKQVSFYLFAHSKTRFYIQKERQKFESERELIQQRASKQILDLQANVQRLQAVDLGKKKN